MRIDRQDTTDVNLFLRSIPDTLQTGGLRIKRVAPLPIEPLPVRDTLEESVPREQEQSPQPTMAQIRYWRWQREQNLLVGDSRYIIPRNDMQLASKVVPENPGLVLPANEMIRSNSDWLTIVLLLALVLFASVRNSWSGYLRNLFQSIVNYSTAYRMFLERNNSLVQGAFRLDIYFHLIFAVFLFQVVPFFQIGRWLQGYRLYIFILGAVIVYFLLKKILYKFIGIIFENTTETEEFLYNMNNYNRVAGMVLFPFTAAIAFFPFSNMLFFIYIGIGISLFIYFLLLFRGFVILLKKQFSIIYLFLYFCTLEFLPLVLVYKILVT